MLRKKRWDKTSIHLSASRALSTVTSRILNTLALYNWFQFLLRALVLQRLRPAQNSASSVHTVFDSKGAFVASTRHIALSYRKAIEQASRIQMETYWYSLVLAFSTVSETPASSNALRKSFSLLLMTLAVGAGDPLHALIGLELNSLSCIACQLLYVVEWKAKWETYEWV